MWGGVALRSLLTSLLVRPSCHVSVDALTPAVTIASRFPLVRLPPPQIPHTAYRTLLTRLAARGYIILATPYTLSFNYLSTLSSLLTPYGRATTALALDYGPLPVIGVGHSAGALLHLLAGALFRDDADKAANILISWNNKSAADAVPLPGLSSLIPAAAAAAVDAVPAEAEATLSGLVELVDGLLLGEDPLPVVPPAVREELLRPLVADGRRVAAQVPALVRELAAMAAGATYIRN